MTETIKRYADPQSVTFHGRIAFMETAVHEGTEFLSVTLAHNVSETLSVRVVFTNSNGLLTAYRNGNLMVGQELTVIGVMKGIRAFYIKDDVLTPLKSPEIQVRCQQYIFGSKPQAKMPQGDVPFDNQPTLEEVPF